jgi:predicted alpha/beta hydrolase
MSVDQVLQGVDASRRVAWAKFYEADRLLEQTNEYVDDLESEVKRYKMFFLFAFYQFPKTYTAREVVYQLKGLGHGISPRSVMRHWMEYRKFCPVPGCTPDCLSY